MTRRLILLLLVCGLPALCGTAPNRSSSEVRYELWSQKLIAPCCWRESIGSHRSPAADQARLELRELVDQDSTDQEIRDVFVGRYGAAVLMTPDGDRGRWLFTLPVVFILTATVIAVLTLRRMLVRRPRLEPAGVGPEIEVDEKDLDW